MITDRQAVRLGVDAISTTVALEVRAERQADAGRQRPGRLAAVRLAVDQAFPTAQLRLYTSVEVEGNW